MPEQTTSRPPAEAFDLRESISLTEAAGGAASIFDEDGLVPIHIMRPCVGKGKGRHLYEADMLQENAHKFTGWKMYVDHESEQARKAAGGLPRKTRDLGGRIVESYWDPNVPADEARGFGQGAVIGKAKPVRYIRELIEDDPEILEASISAAATGVRPVVRGGQRAWLVEGIEDRGSVDWVTEAGAGGRVAALIEAAYAEEDHELPLLESMSDEDFIEYAQERGLDITEADSKAKPKKCPNCGHKVEFGRHKNCEKCGASMKKLAESISEGDDMPITPEDLQEALVENPQALVAALAQSSEAQVFISSLVEAKVEEEREAIKAEVKAESDAASSSPTSPPPRRSRSARPSCPTRGRRTSWAASPWSRVSRPPRST
jgi:ribosomal protein S27AE